MTRMTERCSADVRSYLRATVRPLGAAAFGPEGISFSMMEGGTYGGYELTDAECESKNKIYIYAKDEHGFARRFLLVRKDGRWLVDKCQGMDGKNRGL